MIQDVSVSFVGSQQVFAPGQSFGIRVEVYDGNSANTTMIDALPDDGYAVHTVQARSAQLGADYPPVVSSGVLMPGVPATLNFQVQVSSKPPV